MDLDPIHEAQKHTNPTNPDPYSDPDPQHWYPDPAFYTNADPDLDPAPNESDANLKPLVSRAVLRIWIWIRIRRIPMIFGLPDPVAVPLVRDMDPDPSIIKQK